MKIPKVDVGEPAAGTALTNIYAQTYVGQGVPGVGSVVSPVDRGPKEEETYGTDYVVGDCIGDGGGTTEPVSPLPKLKAKTTRPKYGTRMRAVASLGVCDGHARTNIELQRKVGSSFRKIATKKLGRKCNTTFRIKAAFKKATFRSYWPQQDEDHGAAGSKPVTIRPRR